MTSSQGDIWPFQKNSDSASADEMPKVPHHPFLQKFIRCDVPDISVVSDIDNETGDKLYSGQHRQISYPRETILYSKCNGGFPIEGVSRTECLTKIHSKDIQSSGMSNKNIHKQYPQTSNIDSAHSNENPILLITENRSASPTVKVPELSFETLEYLKRQDEKLNAIQEQVSQVLAQNQPRSYTPSIASDQKEFQNIDKNLPALLTDSKDTDMSPTRNTCLSAHKEELLIKCLLNQSEQIQKLQEQVNWLLLKTEQLSLNASENERTTASPQRIDIPSTSGRNPALFEEHQPRLLEIAANKQGDSVEMCREETKVMKQSTSTMTSLTLNGNDKFVIHKKLTVVTDSSKFQKEVSAQCSYSANGVASPEKQVAIKNVRSGGKAPKSTRCSPKCNCSKKNFIASGSSDVASPDKELIQPSPVRNESPLSVPERKDERKEELQNMEPKIEKYIPNYENIMKNVNEIILDTEHHNTPPSKKKQTSRPRQKHTTAPVTKKSPTKHTRNIERNPDRRSSSSSSIDSIQHTPRKACHVIEESSTASRYGLSSPNLSVATKQYLENYGLVQDKSNDNERAKSSRKTRTSLSKRYPR